MKTNVIIEYSRFHELISSYEELLRNYKYKCREKCPFCDGEYGNHNPFCESNEAKIIFRVENVLSELIDIDK